MIEPIFTIEGRDYKFTKVPGEDYSLCTGCAFEYEHWKKCEKVCKDFADCQAGGIYIEVN